MKKELLECVEFPAIALTILDNRKQLPLRISTFWNQVTGNTWLGWGLYGLCILDYLGILKRALHEKGIVGMRGIPAYIEFQGKLN